MMLKPAQLKRLDIKRLAYSFLLFAIFYLLFSIRPAFAQAAPNTNPDVPQNLHTYTQNAMIEVMAATICQITGVDPIDPKQKCLGVDVKTGKIGFVEGGGGAIGAMGGMIAMLYNPPLHTGDYFAYLGQNFGLAKPAYAAYTTGFAGLKPLMGLWSAFRNIVYLFFVVVFVVIGLAVMLRIKIDPRTVMSIENQIPKIIIGLILVTFSFAIAGFLIDLMYIVIYLVFNVFTSAVGSGVNFGDLNPMNIQGKNAIEAAGGLLSFGGIGGVSGMTTEVSGNLKSVIQSFLGITACSSWGNCLNALFNPANFAKGGFDNLFEINVLELLFNTISIGTGFAAYRNVAALASLNVFGIDVGKVVGLAGGVPFAISTYAFTQYFLREMLPFLIIYLILFFAILFSLFRLWFQLLMAYVSILIDVVFAPFWILAGLFPGSPVSFGSWLRDILANLSAFPVTILMFLLAKVFITSFDKTPSGEQFVPPLIGNPGSMGLIGSLIGLGVILLTPQVVAMMKDALKAPQFKQMAAIGQALGVGPAAAGGIVTAIGSPYGGLFMFRNLQKELGKEGDIGKFFRGLPGRFGPGVTEGKKPASPEA